MQTEIKPGINRGLFRSPRRLLRWCKTGFKNINSPTPTPHPANHFLANERKKLEHPAPLTLHPDHALCTPGLAYNLPKVILNFLFALHTFLRRMDEFSTKEFKRRIEKSKTCDDLINVLKVCTSYLISALRARSHEIRALSLMCHDFDELIGYQITNKN